jgi:hypothetical protein
MFGMQTAGLAELALPPQNAQGQLPFEHKRPDEIDEVAKQSDTLEEPEAPEGAPAR